MISERRLYLFEAEDDVPAADNTADTAETNDTSADNAEDTANDNQTEDNNQEEENNTDQQEDNQEDDNQNDEEDGNDDFTINDDDNNGEENNDNQPSEDDMYSSGDDNQQKSDALKAKDRELFDSLTLAEQQIKIRELKNNFVDLYNNCTSLIDRYNEISLECEEDITHIKKISSQLLDIKGMISFYILNLYDLKSYVENDLMFNRYLAVFNAIKNVTKIIKNNNKEEE